MRKQRNWATSRNTNALVDDGANWESACQTSGVRRDLRRHACQRDRGLGTKSPNALGHVGARKSHQQTAISSSVPRCEEPIGRLPRPRRSPLSVKPAPAHSPTAGLTYRTHHCQDAIPDRFGQPRRPFCGDNREPTRQGLEGDDMSDEREIVFPLYILVGGVLACVHVRDRRNRSPASRRHVPQVIPSPFLGEVNTPPARQCARQAMRHTGPPELRMITGVPHYSEFCWICWARVTPSTSGIFRSESTMRKGSLRAVLDLCVTLLRGSLLRHFRHSTDQSPHQEGHFCSFTRHWPHQADGPVQSETPSGRVEEPKPPLSQVRRPPRHSLV